MFFLIFIKSFLFKLFNSFKFFNIESLINLDCSLECLCAPPGNSGMISSISYSDGIVEIPEQVNNINKGDVILCDNLLEKQCKEKIWLYYK